MVVTGIISAGNPPTVRRSRAFCLEVGPVRLPIRVRLRPPLLPPRARKRPPLQPLVQAPLAQASSRPPLQPLVQAPLVQAPLAQASSRPPLQAKEPLWTRKLRRAKTA